MRVSSLYVYYIILYVYMYLCGARFIYHCDTPHAKSDLILSKLYSVICHFENSTFDEILFDYLPHFVCAIFCL